MSTDVAERVRGTLRAIPDYPKPGIIFQDITPVLHNGRLFAEAVDAMAAPFRGAGVTHVRGDRGARLHPGGAAGRHIGAGFIPLRKPGKLPWESVGEKYALEYGEDSLHAHRDACKAAGPGADCGRRAGDGRDGRGGGAAGAGTGRGTGGVDLPARDRPLEGRQRLGGTAPSVSLVAV